jgi:GNAT superfamily N-acetyltransferase
MIQYQKWKDEVRILITDEQNYGSVQVSIPCYNSKISGKADALIYALYVDSGCREQGVATKLLQSAEHQAKLNGVQVIGIEFDKEESESFVLDWYFRSGYKPFKKKSNLLIKELKG